MKKYRIHFTNKQTHDISAMSPRAARRHTRSIFPNMEIAQTQELQLKHTAQIMREVFNENLSAKLNNR